jgi:type I restriction enzyme M protein
MTVQTHQQLAAFIWSICNLLRGPYKRNEYRKVILPLTVMRRFDCILAPTKAKILEKYEKVKDRPDKVVQSQLCSITGRDFYNISKLDSRDFWMIRTIWPRTITSICRSRAISGSRGV